MKKICLLVLFLITAFFLWGQSDSNLFDSAIEDLQQGRYAQAVSQFTQVLSDPQYAAYYGDAYFWTSKALIAENRISDAERYLEFFLGNFQNNKNYTEALYQRGRILYLDTNYEAAIIAFSNFIARYSSSPFVANAYYWSGESLFNLGQLDQAEKMFSAVITEFPTGYRVEAARYRLAVIGLSRREQELIKLLQWTQEESLQHIEDSQKRELEYQEAISSYQTRIANSSTGAVRVEINNLRDTIATLESERTELKRQITTQENTIRRLENEIRTLRNSRSSFGQQEDDSAISSNEAGFQQ